MPETKVRKGDLYPGIQEILSDIVTARSIYPSLLKRLESLKGGSTPESIFTNSINIAKTNFKLNTRISAVRERLSALVIDVFEDLTGIDLSTTTAVYDPLTKSFFPSSFSSEDNALLGLIPSTVTPSQNYWNSGVWDKSNLTDGSASYSSNSDGSQSHTVFHYGTTPPARFTMDLGNPISWSKFRIRSGSDGASIDSGRMMSSFKLFGSNDPDSLSDPYDPSWNLVLDVDPYPQVYGVFQEYVVSGTYRYLNMEVGAQYSGNVASVGEIELYPAQEAETPEALVVSTAELIQNPFSQIYVVADIQGETDPSLFSFEASIDDGDSWFPTPLETLVEVPFGSTPPSEVNLRLRATISGNVRLSGWAIGWL